jgi:hypothetical protein
MSFEKNVFINCPFDSQYVPLLRALVFTCLYLDFSPRLAQTKSSSNIRIDQIKKHIKMCKFGIHDLSRSKALSLGELPRFNMPFELGLDVGASEFGASKLKSKRILVLDTERYHYQKVLSDIAGQDISSHEDNPKVLVKRVRDWFSNNSNQKITPYSQIWIAYNQFTDDLSNTLLAHFELEEIQEMSIGDFIKFAKDWITKFKS